MSQERRPDQPDQIGQNFQDDELFGSCGHCQRIVTNADPDHRVTPILHGGRGVECALRGDFTPGDDK